MEADHEPDAIVDADYARNLIESSRLLCAGTRRLIARSRACIERSKDVLTVQRTRLKTHYSNRTPGPVAGREAGAGGGGTKDGGSN
jgi:hypothetical protein